MKDILTDEDFLYIQDMIYNIQNTLSDYLDDSKEDMNKATDALNKLAEFSSLINT